MLLLKREYDCLKTFKNLAIDDKKSYKLARSGFYYTNFKDQVKCYFCSVDMNALSCPEDVETEHLRRSPNCMYANGQNVCGPYTFKTPGLCFQIYRWSCYFVWLIL